MRSLVGTYSSPAAFCICARHVAQKRVSDGASRLAQRTAARASIPAGIDLGTTNSAIAVCIDGAVRLLPDPEGRETVPSVVAYKEVRSRTHAACALKEVSTVH